MRPHRSQILWAAGQLAPALMQSIQAPVEYQPIPAPLEHERNCRHE